MALAEIDREREDFTGFSVQPRFKEDAEDFFVSIFRFAKSTIQDEPAYAVDSRVRDRWLREVVKLESHMMGILNSVVDIDKNRGWRMVGGRNQVMKYTKMLHNFQAAPGLFGWRHCISAQSQAFWGTDMGAVTEIGRKSKNGPLRALYTVDPTKCVLTGNEDYPLNYYPKKISKPIKWRLQDFMRTTSMPSTADEFNGLGYCAVSRALELTKLMVAINEHDAEVLGSRAPRGLLLLQGISQKQWQDAMMAREEDLDGVERDYFANVAVLASASAGVDSKLVAMSNLPAQFNMKEWMDMLIYGYALCFGFDASEFYPVQFGALGRGTETELQHEKATGKGRTDFVLGYQEQLQEFLPESLTYEFDQRDEKGDLLHAQVKKATTDYVTDLYESGLGSGVPLLEREEARSILAEFGVIPQAWADKEDITTTDAGDDPDVDDDVDVEPTSEDVDEAEEMGAERMVTRKMRILREELLQNPQVVCAAQRFPTEPIVQYSFPANTVIPLWSSGEDLLKRSVWNGYKT